MRRRQGAAMAAGLAFGLVSSACGDDEGAYANGSGAGITQAGDDYMDPPEPPIDCDDDPELPECDNSGGSAGAQGAPAGGPCDDTTQCAEGMCVAPFSDGEAGEPVCNLECVDDDDPARWCLDADACCNPESVCTPRGFCIPAEDLGEGESGREPGDDDDDDDDDDSGTTGGSGGSGNGSGTAGGESGVATGDPAGSTGPGGSGTG